MIHPRTIFLSVALLFTLVAAANAEEQINWIKSFEDAEKIAKETGKPMLLDFTASWCKPCLLMDRHFWVRPDIIKASEQFVCVKVNFDMRTDLRRKYGVRGIPNVTFTDPWGRLMLFIIGFGNGVDDKFFQKISILPADFHLIKDAGNQIDDDKEDITSLTKVANFYHQRKFYLISNDFYKRLLKLETDPAKREAVMTRIGFNYLSSDSPDDALDIFERARKDFPQGAETDMVIYGQIFASHAKGKAKDAQKFLTQLKTQFPNSEMVAKAEQTLARPVPAKK